jgi:hypothetical protein
VALPLVAAMGWLVALTIFRVWHMGAGYNNYFAWGQIPAGPFAFLVILASVVTPLARRVFGPGAWSHNDTLFVYAAVLGTLTLASVGCFYYVPDQIAAPFYFDGGHSSWAQAVVPHIPRWMLLDVKTGQDELLRRFYEGNPDYTARVPWDLWLRPLAAWGGLVATAYFTILCLNGVFRRRWFDQEHITFPFADLAQAVAGAPTPWYDRAGPGLWHGRLLWTGFAITFLHWCVKALPAFISGFPDLTFKTIPLSSHITVAPWNVLSWRLEFDFQWISLGVAYLIPSQISLGTVFFYFLSLLEMVGLYTVGATGGDWEPVTIVLRQALGGLLVFIFFLFWTARAEIRAMGRDALADVLGHGGPAPHPDRWLLVGSLAGFIGMWVWAVAAGVDFWIAALFIAALLLFQLSVSRLIAVLGMQHAWTAVDPTDLLDTVLGQRALGPANLINMRLLQQVLWYAQPTTFIAMTLQAHRFGHIERWRTSRYVPGLLACAAFALAVYVVIMLRLAYRHGGLAISSIWYIGYIAPGLYQRLAALIANPAGPQVGARLGMLAGVGIMCGLMACHRMFPWWPVHPLGFLLGGGWTMLGTWPGLLMGWAVKAVVSHYGGPSLYLRTRPFFLGIILGDLLGQTVTASIGGLALGLGLVHDKT